MKITNQQMVNFVNMVSGHKGKSGIIEKNIPMKLFSALDLNVKALLPAAETYNKQRNECNDADALTELLKIEVEAVIQTVPEEIFERMDESDKFDALTGSEYSALQFMITK
ncbi:MAG: hypothetical protein IJZ34_11010 [Lachnospiraceae bacterium]|nr:hypothetical protein [Lachnospiraceae bacterium]